MQPKSPIIAPDQKAFRYSQTTLALIDQEKQLKSVRECNVFCGVDAKFIANVAIPNWGKRFLSAAMPTQQAHVRKDDEKTRRRSGGTSRYNGYLLIAQTE